jgi:hypothetical protein
MPTETDDNSKSLRFAGLGRQRMCFWTISRSTNYRIPAGGTKRDKTALACNKYRAIENKKKIEKAVISTL